MAILRYLGKLVLFFVLLNVILLTFWGAVSTVENGHQQAPGLFTAIYLILGKLTFLAPWVMAAVPLRISMMWMLRALVLTGALASIYWVGSHFLALGHYLAASLAVGVLLVFEVARRLVLLSPRRPTLTLRSGREHWMETARGFYFARKPVSTTFSIANDPKRLIIEQGGDEPVWGRPGHIFWRMERVFYEVDELSSGIATGNTSNHMPTRRSTELAMVWRSSSLMEVFVEQSPVDNPGGSDRTTLYQDFLSKKDARRLLRWLDHRKSLLAPNHQRIQAEKDERQSEEIRQLRSASKLDLVNLREAVERDESGNLLNYVAAATDGSFYGWSSVGEDIRGGPHDLDALKSWKAKAPGRFTLAPDVERRILNAAWSK